MHGEKPLPQLWLLSDVRNDAALERSLLGLTAQVGFVYRHYHLPPAERRARFVELARIARAQGHVVILAGSARQARAWGADGAYGSPATIGRQRPGILMITTAHDLREIGAANRMGADAVMLSPVFPTRSHPGAPTLGPLAFRLLAARAAMPVIPLGGMSRAANRRLGWDRWAAIDGLTSG